jgi:hypothetical protein
MKRLLIEQLIISHLTNYNKSKMLVMYLLKKGTINLTVIFIHKMVKDLIINFSENS